MVEKSAELVRPSPKKRGRKPRKEKEEKALPKSRAKAKAKGKAKAQPKAKAKAKSKAKALAKSKTVKNHEVERASKKQRTDSKFVQDERDKERRARLSRKSSAYHQAVDRYMALGMSRDEAKIEGRKVTCQLKILKAACSLF